MTVPVLAVRDLSVHFPVATGAWFARRRPLRAVDGVSFAVAAGETLGIVGESGCGKSTLARAIIGLVRPTTGTIELNGAPVDPDDRAGLRARRRAMQIVFQDPLASLNPRMTVGEIVAEPLRTHRPGLDRADRDARVADALAGVGLLAAQRNRYPHEFSGGQCQRIGIARALMLDPTLLVCDEPVSALDVSVQAQIVNLLTDLQAERGLSLIFIAHDLAVVRHISHRVLVMYLGRVAEIADRDALYARPRHPYTQALIDAVPVPDPAIERRRERRLLDGDLPSPLDPPSGCAFRTRCPLASARCASEVPELRPVGRALVACHHAKEAG